MRELFLNNLKQGTSGSREASKQLLVLLALQVPPLHYAAGLCVFTLIWDRVSRAGCQQYDMMRQPEEESFPNSVQAWRPAADARHLC